MYGDFAAVKKIDCKFSPGVYGLLGPNGAGKSTWMKLLTASLKPTEGGIYFDGILISNMSDDYVGKVGYVPQNQNLFPYFTGYKFLYYMATLKGVKKELADKQIPLLLRRVNMEEIGKQKIHAYSGGMKQRLLIAQAFLGNPQMIYMDEPTAGLDPKERIRIRNLISEMSLGKIILIATHVVSDVEYISKEILLMKSGEIIRSGTPESLEDELNGLVYEREVNADELDFFMEKHLVAGIRKEGDSILVRYLNQLPDDMAKSVRPTLDDVYLYHFREEQL
jgi:ABC-type multidrug transport system ATPase subunit